VLLVLVLAFINQLDIDGTHTHRSTQLTQIFRHRIELTIIFVQLIQDGQELYPPLFTGMLLIFFYDFPGDFERVLGTREKVEIRQEVVILHAEGLVGGGGFYCLERLYC
jgi:hypothetical protein